MPYTRTYAGVEPSRSEVESWRGATLVEFGAPWCGYCQRTQGELAEALGARPGLRHVKIEDGPGRPLGRSFRVKLWPTLVLLRDGQEIGRRVRPHDRQEIEELFEQAEA
jgi:thioredoxin 1